MISQDSAKFAALTARGRCHRRHYFVVTGARMAKKFTLADIRLVAAKIYEPQPRIWTEYGWRCPQCRQVNRKTSRECRCGITRDGLPEFCEGDKGASTSNLASRIRWYSHRPSESIWSLRLVRSFFHKLHLLKYASRSCAAHR